MGAAIRAPRRERAEDGLAGDPAVAAVRERVLPAAHGRGLAGAGLGVLSTVGGGVLTQAVTDALDKLRKHGPARPSSQEDVRQSVAQQIQLVLESGSEQAAVLRGEIASVLKEIDAGRTALQATMDLDSERVAGRCWPPSTRSARTSLRWVSSSRTSPGGRGDPADPGRPGRDVRVIMDQNVRQSTDIRRLREDLTAIAARPGSVRRRARGALAGRALGKGAPTGD